MNGKTFKHRLLLSSVFAGAALAVAAAPAVAQEEDEEAVQEKIIITGSRIATVDNYSAVGPVNVISAEEIAISGKTNIGDLLEELPSVAFIGDGTNVNNGSDGLQTVNLRGLGTERVLVLMNGRRVSPVGSGINNLVDLSIFPSSLIGSVEVLKDGAAAVYGADAVSGVINIKTASDYTGFDITASTGMSEYGDAEEFSVGASMGWESDKGNVVAGVSYYAQEGVYQADRDISECPYLEPARGYQVFNDLGFTPADVGSETADPNTVCSGSSFIPSGLIFTSNGSRTVDATGADQPFSFFTDSYNFNPLNYLRTPSTGLNALVIGSYDVSDNVTASLELLYNKRASKQDLAPVPLGLGAQFTYGLTIPAANPFNIYNEDVAYRKRMLDVGARLFDQESDTIRLVGGLNGTLKSSLPLLDNAVFDVYYSYDKNQGTDKNNNLIDMFRVEQAFDTEVTTNTGAGVVTVGGVNYQCADALARQLGCEPLNMFGPGSITPAAAEFIRLNTVDQFESEGSLLSATLSNKLFELPAGEVTGLVGVEVRNISGSTNIDAAIVNGYSSGNPAISTSGEIEAVDYLAEVDIPLVMDQPFFKELRLGLAARYSDYDLFDASETYRASLQWAPIDDLRLRATVSNSYRAPSLSDLFNGGSGGFPTYSDPCASVDPTDVADATAAGVCAAQGVNPGAFSTSNSQLLSFSVGSSLVGNELNPEEGENLTVGLVYTPSFDAVADWDLRFALDYYNIEVSSPIQLEGLQGILNDCYLRADAVQCGKITRQLGGDVLRVDRANENGNATETAAGVDFSMGFGRDVFADSDLLAGTLDFDMRGSYLIEREDTDEDSGASSDFKNRCLGFTSACFNEWRINNTLTYAKDSFAVSWSTRFLSGIDGDEDAAIDLLTNGFSVPADEAPALAEGYTTPYQFYHDVNVRLFVNDTTSLTLGMDNVFGEDAPYLKYVEGFFNPTENSPIGTYDTRGRFGYIRLDKAF